MAVHSIQARPVQNWVTRLANAVALLGYSTVDLRSQPGPQMVTPEQLVAGAQSGFNGLPGGWAQLPGHIQGLVPLDVDSIALRAERRILHLVLGRSGSPISIEAAEEYFKAVEFWYRTTMDLLPRLRANEQEKSAVQSVSTLVGGSIGPGVGPIVAKALTALIEASNGGTAVTIHPVTNGSEFAQQWSRTNLTSLPHGGIGNRNWLWETDAGRITESDESDDFGIGPPMSIADLGTAIQGTSG